jgi:flagellar basal-body rod modification protein FlgD
MISPIPSQFGLETIGGPSSSAGKPDDSGKLGQEEFLRLMITQLKNQDPTKPLDSGEFLGQLAQFGTVSGLADLKSSFTELAGSLVSNQALQAAGLVGRSVLARSGAGYLTAGEGLSGAVDLPASSGDVRVQIVDATGQLVREIDLGAQASGLVRFSWAGDTNAGQIVPDGRYSISAQFFDGAAMQSADTLVRSTVESVSLGSGGLGIKLRGLGEVSFSAVEEIG